MPNQLRVIEKGDAFDPLQINQLIDEINRWNKIKGGEGIGVVNDANGLRIYLETAEAVVLGQIVASGDCTAADGSPGTGETISTTNKYYVETGYLSTIDTDACNSICKFTKFANTDSRWKSVVATNISENNLGSHQTPIGTWVLLHRQYDLGSPPFERWYFEHTEPSIGQYQGMVHQVLAQNQDGWDFVLAPPALT